MGDAAAETGRQALSASQVPQWSSVQVPDGLKIAPDDVVNFLGESGVNPLLLLGGVAAIAVPALLFQVRSPSGCALFTLQTVSACNQMQHAFHGSSLLTRCFRMAMCQPESPFIHVSVHLCISMTCAQRAGE